MPLEGYTPMFERMLDHPNITVELETDALNRLRLVLGVQGVVFRVDDGVVGDLAVRPGVGPGWAVWRSTNTITWTPSPQGH